MPKPHIPFEGPRVSPLSDREIRAFGQQLFETHSWVHESQDYGHPADALLNDRKLAERLGLRLIDDTSGSADLRIEARYDAKPIIYTASMMLGTGSRNLANVISISSYLLHVQPALRDGIGIQVVKDRNHPHSETNEMRRQAKILATELLLPEEPLRRIWNKHGPEDTPVFFQLFVPKDWLSSRIKELDLKRSVAA